MQKQEGWYKKMMVAYKAFDPNFKCRGYQYEMKKWEKEDMAECRAKGFHSAYEPFDCLNYYSWDGRNKFCIVIIDGLIHEEDGDTKISSTKLLPYKQLTLEEFVYEEIVYLINNPYSGSNSRVNDCEECVTNDRPYIIVRGKNPKVTIKKKSIVVGILKEEADSKKIREVNFFTSGSKYPAGIYDVTGKIGDIKKNRKHC